jgi:hypothetical protein
MNKEVDNSLQSALQEKLVPPHTNTTWYAKFFDKIQKKDFERFDKEIIQINIIGGVNAGRMFKELRFLGLVEEDGKVTDDFKSLRRFGDEFSQNLKKIVEKSYSLLFEKVAIESASNETLLNFFVKCYGFGETIAKRAIKIFIYLCQRAGITLPEQLTITAPKNEAIATKPKSMYQKNGPKITKGKMKGKVDVLKKEDLGDTKGMHPISWGDTIRILLKETEDKQERLKIANQAKKLIDLYVEE